MKKTMITVIYKKGDVRNPQNYRLMCGLPQLYKLFSTMLYNWFYAVLDRYQCAAQADFRKTFQTTDHFMTYKLISQTRRGWETDMLVAAMDFKKAF